MTVLACLACAVIGYFVGIARGYLLADRDAGREDCAPLLFDAWQGEGWQDSGSSGHSGSPNPLAHDVENYTAGFRAGWQAAEQMAELRAERMPGMRERAAEGMEGGRELDRGKVIG